MKLAFLWLKNFQRWICKILNCNDKQASYELFTNDEYNVERHSRNVHSSVLSIPSGVAFAANYPLHADDYKVIS